MLCASERIPRPKRREAKERATVAAKALIQLATATATEDLGLARKQAALARKLMLRYNVRFGWDLRRFYCHGCKELIVPGVNARVRLSRGTILTTCANCGRVNRKRLAQP